MGCAWMGFLRVLYHKSGQKTPVAFQKVGREASLFFYSREIWIKASRVVWEDLRPIRGVCGARGSSGILSSLNSLIYPQELIPVCPSVNCPLGTFPGRPHQTHSPEDVPEFQSHKMNLPRTLLRAQALGWLRWLRGMFNPGACGLAGSDPQVSLPVE